MNDDYTTDSHSNTYTFLLKDLGECNFLILGMKGLMALMMIMMTAMMNSALDTAVPTTGV